MSDDTTPGDETVTTADADAPAERVDAAGSDGLTATLDAPPESELDHGVPVTWSRGQKVLHPDREGYHDLVATLHDEGFVVCVDVTAVDFLTHAAPRHLPVSVVPERFEVVVGLLNHSERTRVRLRVQVPESDPALPTIFDLHPGAEAPEREVFDMFGIAFTDHPDLTRILMPEDWQGHPLRKDYDSGRIPVQFKAATNQR